MIMGYLLVTAVLVVTLGRLGDMFGRVRMYNLGFAIFTFASIALSFDPFLGVAGALWLIIWRVVQAVCGSMLMANSAAILTVAFPATHGGMAAGVALLAAFCLVETKVAEPMFRMGLFKIRAFAAGNAAAMLAAIAR